MEKLQERTKIKFKSKNFIKNNIAKKLSNKVYDYVNIVILPVLMLILWIIATYLELFSPAILPSISTVFDSLKSQLSSGQLIKDISVSLIRVLEGYLIAAALGITLGVLMGISERINKLFFLTFTSMRQIPMLAWIPLIVLWFGIGESSKIIVIVIAAYFPILLNTMNGIKRTDKKLIEVGNMYSLSKWKLFTKIYFPSALPSIFVGLKLGLGISWMAVVGAEIIASSSGIGYRMNDARSLMQPEVVFVGMIVIALIGIVMDQILTRISKKITPWENNK
ncbi:ABC transporter permease [Clostridium beijerinckii]|uniref:ABC transporter permease n=1 Tax=Clostridium beijerinckii TaxID=1520 RepID=UPI00098C2213|nr:ABC transporter permease [Clostridium beijerinckii]MBA8934180.1 sulfonate transport system permease protein [Clostridium beijerinckii]NRU38374.1 sulfonate transport system permease protein [Clostridium beijerinckii]NSA98348.1 sulfonate transport system permease protein [Clostridium beijerinckii]OOM69060.1 putative aliphatic sulfonates transport permease protein SsuC [Clostridium beijerinckii]OOM69373.1 putative aliphatic sulfonates transport permease protein SsuC [Clostridium beijerinckii]